MDIFDELTFTSNLIFPIFSFELKCEAGKALFREHWHTEMEYLMVDRGACRITIGSHTHTLGEGQTAFIHHGKMHGATALLDAACGCRGVIFDSKLLVSQGNYALDRQCWDQLLAYITRSNNVLTGGNERVSYLFNDIYQLCVFHPYAYELAVKAGLYEMFFLLFRETEEREDAGGLSKEVDGCIARHLDENIPIEAPFGELNISRQALEDFLCRENLTWRDYVRRFKLNLAVEQLANSAISITDLAHALGFSDASYFDLIFKRYMKRTPSEYRRIILPKAEA